MTQASGGKPRLCVLLPSHWAAHMGGAEFQARLILERLLALDLFELHYVARNVDSAYRPEGYRIHTIGSGPRLAGTFFLDAPHLWRVLNRLRPDVIYQRVGCAYTGIAARYARWSGARMVWHVAIDRDVTPLSWDWSLRAPLALVEKRVLEYGVRNATAIIVQSMHQGRLLQERYGRGYTALIPNFHPDTGRPVTKPANPVRVCWVANFKPFKRPDLFLRLARDLRHLAKVEFVMVGRLPAAANGETAARLRDAPHVRYLGELPIEEVNSLLAQAHILVNTSDYEGFSNVFIQAWMREVPVVSLNVNPDGVFDDDRHGVCAHGSYETMRSAVERLTGDRDLRGTIGQRARHFALERYALANIDRVVGLLDPTLSGLAVTGGSPRDASVGASP